jgi:hypothetical protein
MSPLSQPNPCPFVIECEGFYFCAEYKNRPDQCKKHEYPFRHCPIGIEKLGLDSTMRIATRIDRGWELARTLS